MTGITTRAATGLSLTEISARRENVGSALPYQEKPKEGDQRCFYGPRHLLTVVLFCVGDRECHFWSKKEIFLADTGVSAQTTVRPGTFCGEINS
jgi:hypothetical protein